MGIEFPKIPLEINGLQTDSLQDSKWRPTPISHSINYVSNNASSTPIRIVIHTSQPRPQGLNRFRKSLEKLREEHETFNNEKYFIIAKY